MKHLTLSFIILTMLLNGCEYHSDAVYCPYIEPPGSGDSVSINFPFTQPEYTLYWDAFAIVKSNDEKRTLIGAQFYADSLPIATNNYIYNNVFAAYIPKPETGQQYQVFADLVVLSNSESIAGTLGVEALVLQSEPCNIIGSDLQLSGKIRRHTVGEDYKITWQAYPGFDLLAYKIGSNGTSYGSSIDTNSIVIPIYNMPQNFEVYVISHDGYEHLWARY
jgi:hypothetical protein